MEEEVRKLRIMGAYAHYDDEADTLYVHIGDREAREAVEIEEGVIIDLDKDGEIAGITITGIKQRIKT